ncbi:zinc finger and BTB domain-containing protein 7B isoform X2 [Hyaena hyaena]|nr:zinc finger and BTB domain-containing protein 7B isoform X2 [Hyaena hyaena]XP_039107373.1 zinc finger and BTB domain-containing protein 7B isoform X2 [Hyaena hyaena]XP_039107374.1 zinc finger and BTB domain-containing protein 7B isoform X2 [Hyaena hyaena]XP_039107375.1 zinc finger and BTB domain-containing protein 7B isoform X2 [Hyaena hyaena]
MGSPEDDLIGIPFPDHSSELLSCLNEQRQLGHLCDLTIRTQGLEYRTHRAVLAACSHYFKKLFTEGGGGGGVGAGGGGPAAGGAGVCELDFVGPEALGALLEFAYTATLTTSSANMPAVLQAARLLEIPCVIAACVDILQGSGREAPGPDEDDCERARQYLEAFAATATATASGVPNGADSPPQGPLPPPPPPPPPAPPAPRPVARRSRKPRKAFLQTRGARANHLVPELPPVPSRPVAFEEEEEVAGRVAGGGPGDGSSPPAGTASPPAGPLSYEAYEGEEEEEELVYPTAYGLAQGGGPPLSPEELGSDEDAIDPDLMAYLSSLHQDALAPGLDGQDKLVRKRRSQMPQECPVCHKIIHGAGKLPRHMRTHTGEKPFACEVCGVRFTRNDKLKIHMRKHTGERPYCCPHCPARFLHSYDLKNHMHLHTGDRPFECHLCHKAFAKEDHLQRHLKGQNCLEVRTRRRRKDDAPPHYPPPSAAAPPPAGLDLSNGHLDAFRLSLTRFWEQSAPAGPPVAPLGPPDDDEEEGAPSTPRAEGALESS